MKKFGKTNPTTAQITAVRELYHLMLDYWNARDAKAIASLYEEEGNMVGFDGSQINGKKEIHEEMKQIFKLHKTDPFIGIVKEVRFIRPKTALVRANAGMVPRGQKGKKKEINPTVNSVQTMIAVLRSDGDWYISLFQNTPARFHGRPEVSKEFSRELRELLKN